MSGPTVSKRAQITTVAVAVIAAGVWLGAWLSWSSWGPLKPSEYHVRASVPTAAALGVNANVTIAGLDVGRVAAVRRRDGGAVLDLAIEEKYAPLPVDSRLSLRQRTVVGENYVEIQPGRSTRMLPDRGALAAGAADDYVDVDQILGALRGKTRERARRMIQGIGNGLDGRGPQLRSTVTGAAGTILASGPVDAILASQRRQVARLSVELGDVTAAIGRRGASVRDVAEGIHATFGAVAERDAELRATLQRLPATIEQVRHATGVVRSVTRHSTPVVSQLARTVDDLGPSIRLLQPAATTTDELLDRVARATPPLVTTLQKLRAVSGPAANALPRVKATLCQVTPAAAYLSPYAKELGSLLQGMGGGTNFYDANGHAARLFVTIGENNAHLLDDRTSDALATLMQAGLIGKGHALGYNPLPAPGQAGETLQPDPAPTGPSRVKATYPRIQAAC